MLNTAERERFSEAARKGLCSHAYIVDGAAGVGKYGFALFCASALLCTSSYAKPCGVCPSCIKCAQGEHPDLVTVGGEKAATVPDVRELIHRSSLKPNDGERQVFIVRNADKMLASAQNALLKLFEEPPESVTVFLLTESRSSLLPTVLSRGQRIHLDGMTEQELCAALKKEFPAKSETEISAAAARSDGNAGSARDYLSTFGATLRAEAHGIASLALARKRYELFTALVQPKYKREHLSALLGALLELSETELKRKSGVRMQADGEPLPNATKKALAAIGEAAQNCLMALETNANVTAAASKLAIELSGVTAR
ncbi:MAG: hypothetical protein J5925_00155 [Clostridia bacterium]|nr:hypothetical protein [Clostridia bacterium]